jgi:predicted house-cleaning noncanonical NTP pyrophosphatase (MazG superfamily)
MPKIIYKKLIRDKIPEIIKTAGKTPAVTVLGEKDFKKFLKIKMVEEAEELVEAESRDDILNELCDVEELVLAIVKNFGFSSSELEKAREKKNLERGGFEKKLFLEYVD